MFRKDHCPNDSQNVDAPGGSNNKNNININLGGTTLLLLIASGIMLGLDIAERSSQERRAAAEATAVQTAIAKQTADLQRSWQINTEQLQRDWFLNTSQLQRDWQSQTTLQVKKMDDLQRQYRMAELKLDDTTVVLHRAGLQLPGDYTRGPQGNMDAESFKFGSSAVWPCNEDSSILCTTIISGGIPWEQAESSINEPK